MKRKPKRGGGPKPRKDRSSIKQFHVGAYLSESEWNAMLDQMERIRVESKSDFLRYAIKCTIALE